MNIYQLLGSYNEQENGCKMQMHIPCKGYALSNEKEKRIIERAMMHQLIVFENPPPLPLDDLNKNTKNIIIETSPLSSN